jgi:hypothetical protein
VVIGLNAELDGDIAMNDVEKLKQWELFRAEMQNNKDKFKKLAVSFLELDAFEDAAKCAIKADGIDFVLKRMPNFNEVR